MNLTKNDRAGWTAETIYPMGDAGNDMHGRPMTRELHLTTRKDSGGKLVTHATVYSVGPTMRTHNFSFGGGGDFSRGITKSDARATEKTVRAQHEAAERMSDVLLSMARAHYASGKDQDAA
jgi:hypothetical protein